LKKITFWATLWGWAELLVQKACVWQTDRWTDRQNYNSYYRTSIAARAVKNEIWKITIWKWNQIFKICLTTLETSLVIHQPVIYIGMKSRSIKSLTVVWYVLTVVTTG